MLGKSTHLAVIPQQSTHNTANLPLQTLASATILLTLVPLQNFSFLFISIVPCTRILNKWSCPLLQFSTYTRTQLPFSIHCIFAYIARLIACLHKVCTKVALLYINTVKFSCLHDFSFN